MAGISSWGLFAVMSVLFLVSPSLQLPPPIPEDLVAEGLFFADPKALERYMDHGITRAGAFAALKEDIEFYITVANKYYQSLRQYGLKLQIWIKDIKLMNNNLKWTHRAPTVDASSLLKSFEIFVDGQAENFDFAILFTGFKLQSGVEGIANRGSICDFMAFGVVGTYRNFDPALVFSHELGHILGCWHDNSLTIMLANVVYEHDPSTFTFSKYSATSMLRHLQDSPRNLNCLKNTQTSSRVPNVTAENYKGTLQDINKLCEYVVGPGSTPCTNSRFFGNSTWDFIGGDRVCFQVACRRQNGHGCNTMVRTPEGMPCGNGKGCNMGRCLAARGSKYNNIDPKCVFGDDKIPFGGVMTCSAVVEDQQQKRFCERPYGFTSCCKTCQKYATNIKDCPFGDRDIVKSYLLTCTELIDQIGKDQLCSQENSTCCKTCYTPEPTTTAEPTTAKSSSTPTTPKQLGPAQTSSAQTGPEQPGPAQTSSAQTGSEQPGPAQTSSAQTGPEQTGPGESNSGPGHIIPGNEFDLATVRGPANDADHGVHLGAGAPPNTTQVAIGRTRSSSSGGTSIGTIIAILCPILLVAAGIVIVVFVKLKPGNPIQPTS